LTHNADSSTLATHIMSGVIAIRQTVSEDSEIVSGILMEVANWQEQAGALYGWRVKLRPSDFVAADSVFGRAFLILVTAEQKDTVLGWLLRCKCLIRFVRLYDRVPPFAAFHRGTLAERHHRN
jgi:hypothetical protein